MAKDIENLILQAKYQFGLQVSKSTIPGNEALLLRSHFIIKVKLQELCVAEELKINSCLLK